MVALLQLGALQRQLGASLIRYLKCQHLVRGRAPDVRGHERCSWSSCPSRMASLAAICAARLRPVIGGGGDVGDQRLASSLQFIATVVDLRGQRFEVATIATRQVELVAHGDAGIVQTELARLTGEPERPGTETLALGADAGVHLRIARGPGPRSLELLRLSQCGTRRRQRRVRCERRVRSARRAGVSRDACHHSASTGPPLTIRCASPKRTGADSV